MLLEELIFQTKLSDSARRQTIPQNSFHLPMSLIMSLFGSIFGDPIDCGRHSAVNVTQPMPYLREYMEADL